MNDSLNCRPADAIAGKLRHRMESLERLKQAISGPGIKSGAIVTHEINGLSIFASGAELNLRLFVSGSVLPGVAEEILQHNSEQCGSASVSSKLEMTNSTLRSGWLRFSSSATEWAIALRSTGSDCNRLLVTRERFNRSSINWIMPLPELRICSINSFALASSFPPYSFRRT